MIGRGDSSAFSFGKAALAAMTIESTASSPTFAQEALLIQESAQLGEATLIPAKLDIVDVGAVERIDYASRLSLLSQQIAANACYLAAGIDADLAKELLIKELAEFDQYIAALRNGDPSLGIIGAEERSKTLKHIDEVEAVWKPFKAAAEAIIAGQDIEKNVALISSTNMTLLERTAILVTDMNAEYANPAELTQANAMVIEIASRQTMLIQRISKDLCGIETGNPTLGTKEDLKKTVELFEVSLTALLNGMPEAGVMVPPTPEILASLQAVSAEWTPIRERLLSVEAMEVIPDEERVKLFEDLDHVGQTMQAVVDKYRTFAKQHL
ncbi:type IV pili methyl-accepting chemotaxis transducer N-terminal domain-containing protein [Tabrizicola sp.]|uniref:type IV pili methyl-accepting chemotaxis transducer N-terminal domain-containing protein n=1 Tax=Tabrizicola sp. TaxID=2005166 RepID=UPI003F2DF1DF